jgi:hypothetical protein
MRGGRTFTSRSRVSPGKGRGGVTMRNGRIVGAGGGGGRGH